MEKGGQNLSMFWVAITLGQAPGSVMTPPAQHVKQDHGSRRRRGKPGSPGRRCHLNLSKEQVISVEERKETTQFSVSPASPWGDSLSIGGRRTGVPGNVTRNM